MTTGKNFSHGFPELVVQGKGEAMHTNKSFANDFLNYPYRLQSEETHSKKVCLL